MTGEYELEGPDAVLLGEYLVDQPEWIHRKVEQATFPRPGTLRRLVSVDCTWEPERNAIATRLDTVNSRRLPIPLGFLRKRTLWGFSVWDESGRALPVLTTDQGTTLSTAVLTTWFAQGALRMQREDSESAAVQQLLRNIVRGPPEETEKHVEALVSGAQLHAPLVSLLASQVTAADQVGENPDAEAAAGELSPWFERLLEPPVDESDAERRAVGYWLLRSFAGAFVLYVDVASRSPSQDEPRPGAGRRILKFGYEVAETADPHGRPGGPAPTHDPARLDMMAPLRLPHLRQSFLIGEHTGIRARSCHTELVPPLQLRVVPEESALLDAAEGPARSRDRTGHQGRAHLHYEHEPELRADDPVWAGYVLEPMTDRGTLRQSRLASGASTLALVSLALLSAWREWGLADPGEPGGSQAVPILLLLPGLLAGYAAARADEHALTLKLLRACRSVLLLIVVAWLAAASPLAFGDALARGQASLRLWEWWLGCAAFSAMLYLRLWLPGHWPRWALTTAALMAASGGAVVWCLIDSRIWERLGA